MVAESFEKTLLVMVSVPEVAMPPPSVAESSLSLLPHGVRVAPLAAESVISGPVPDAVLVDARRDLVLARRVLMTLRATASPAPVIAIVTDGAWAAVSADWGADDLVLHTAGGDVVEHAPVVYQNIGGQRRSVAGRFVLEGNGQVGFQLGAYDRRAPLVIGPVLVCCTSST